jgi:ubiquinone/menaquinone biosynthesis C-methylase UbiE
VSGSALAARLYDPLLEPLVGGFRRAGLEVAPLEPGSRVLDVGCGTGAHLALYAARGAEVTGVDTSTAMLKEARRRLGPEVRLVQAEAAALPFGDGRFDLVVAMTVLHEFASGQRRAVLAEMRRMAAPRGRLLVIDHHPGRPHGARGRMIRRFAATIEWIAGGEHTRNFRDFLASGGIFGLTGPAGLVLERWSVEAAGTMGVYLLRPA